MTEPITDPIELIDTLKDAILRRAVDKEKVLQAIKQVLSGYETQNRIFLIGTAQVELSRIVRLMRFVSNVEEELFKEERMDSANTKDLIRAYALAQTNLVSSLDNVKRIVDMRLELQKAGMSNPAALLNPDSEEVQALSQLPGLDARGRDKVRQLVGMISDAINKDTSVVEFESPEDASLAVDEESRDDTTSDTED